MIHARLAVLATTVLVGGLIACPSAFATPAAPVAVSPPPPLVMQDLAGPPPSSHASRAQWQAWATRQVRSVKSTPWAEEVEAQGQELVSLAYLPVTSTPGAPSGVTTMAVELVVDNTTDSRNNSARNGSATTIQGASPFTTTPHCAYSWSHHGEICVNQIVLSSGAQEVQSTWTSEAPNGWIQFGHLVLGGGGCPGSQIKRTQDKNLSHGETIELIYGPLFASNEWSSSFWEYVEGVYQLDGRICETF